MQRMPPDMRRMLQGLGGSLRRAKRPAEKNTTKGLPTTIREIVTMGVSLVAILISLTTLYYGTFRKVDDLRVLVTDFPHLEISENADGQQEFSLSGRPNFVLINSGNRSAVVLGVYARILQPIDQGLPLPPDSCGGFGGQGEVNINLDMDAFSVGGGEVTAKSTSIGNNKAKATPHSAKVRVSEGRAIFPVDRQLSRNPDEYTARVCLTFTVVSANSSAAFSATSVDLYHSTFRRESYGWTPEVTFGNTLKPTVLLRHTERTFFQ